MIKFFRKIRYNLLQTGKTGEYLKYAIGEIFLVVIGILIALQINNWNEDRKDKKLEQNYLSKIHEEFKQNKEQFDRIISIHRQSYESSIWIIENHNKSDINIDTLRKHLKLFRYSYTYNPSKSSIDAIINSGKLGVIRDNELSNKLIEWNELITDYQEEEIISRNFLDNIILPFDIKHFSIYNADSNKRFDDFLNFNMETKNEFLNIVATKRRMLSQIVDDPQSEYEKIYQSLNVIISKSAKK
jgi:hypothetical protein